VNQAPVSNADVGKTIAQILGLKTRNKGRLMGRVMSEAMPGGQEPKVIAHVRQSPPSPSGLRTLLAFQKVGRTRYFDAGGFPGRTVGLPNSKSAAH